MANAPKVCLVRCPRCGQLLPESADCPVYRCGGCGAILQAKRKVQASDCSSEEYYHSSEESDHKRIRRISEISENLSEKATANLCSTSAWDIKPDMGSLSFDHWGLEGNGTATNLEITSGGDCVSLSAVSSGSIEATKEPVHKPTEILEMMITAKVRLVRCPGCRQVLPESTDFPVYQCGGCGAILQCEVPFFLFCILLCACRVNLSLVWLMGILWTAIWRWMVRNLLKSRGIALDAFGWNFDVVPQYNDS